MLLGQLGCEGGAGARLDAEVADVEVGDVEVADAKPDARQPDFADAQVDAQRDAGRDATLDAVADAAPDAAPGPCEGELDKPCVVGVGSCQRTGWTICTAAGPVCDVQPGVPAPEHCDGLDNDCDGAVDADAQGPLRLPCAVAQAGIGACRAGVSLCFEGVAGECRGAIEPADEICDGLDNDCDAAVDELAPVDCYEGPAGTAGIGTCRGGQRACLPGGGCAGQVLPTLDHCDGLDTDCDGRVDEALACACQPGEARACYRGPPATDGVGVCRGGQQTCRADGLTWNPCEGEVLPAEERCNGVDDDCSGAVDDLPDGGAACTVGVGGCQAAGALVCTPEGLFCDAQPREPQGESCNAVDDDCDGRTDEDFALGTPCAVGVGPCLRAGLIACTGAGDAACDGVPGPSAPETCDGTDQDCNGVADDLPEQGAACAVGIGSCQTEGVLFCAPDRGAFVCGALPGEPGIERCNAEDDDCDGLVDEALVRSCASGPPGTRGVGGCRDGQQRCEAGRFGACLDEVLPAAERCGGQDKDCDGRVDEDFPLEQACTRGLGLCEAVGAWACAEGEVVCDAEGAAPLPETCDGLDEDCDGRVDEGGVCPELFLGDEYACALFRGTLKCWGAVLSLGDLNYRGDRPGEMGAALPAIGFGPDRFAVAVAAGASMRCALLDDGSVRCWGGNQWGQLGQGDEVARGGTPETIPALIPPVDLGTGQRATALAAGRHHVCALLVGGAVKCWGLATDGQLGLGDENHRGDVLGEMGDALPAVDLGTGRTARAIAAGGAKTCALLDNDQLKCWGPGIDGISEDLWAGDGPGEMGDELPAIDLGLGRRALQLVIGGHFCALLDDGALKCWGLGSWGQLGQENRAHYGDEPTERLMDLPAINLGAGRRAISVAAGNGFNCAVLDDRTARCWGYNEYGQLGRSDTQDIGGLAGHMGDQLLPVDLGRPVVAVRAGGYFACAVLAGGAIKCWGANHRGQLGLGDTERRGDEAGEMGDLLPEVQLW